MFFIVLNYNMGNCFTKDAIDRRSARSTFFDAKRREKDAMEYTASQFAKGKGTLSQTDFRKSRLFYKK